MKTSALVKLVFSLALGLLVITAANADDINRRLERQSGRVGHGLDQKHKSQKALMRADDASYRMDAEEQRMKTRHQGNLTRHDKNRLNRQLNRNSGRINRARNN